MSYHKPVARRTPPAPEVRTEPVVRQHEAPAVRAEVTLPSERLLVKIAEAARLLSVSERTIRNLVSDGQLEARGSNRLRRITMASLRRYADLEQGER